MQCLMFMFKPSFIIMKIMKSFEFMIDKAVMLSPINNLDAYKDILFLWKEKKYIYL